MSSQVQNTDYCFSELPLCRFAFEIYAHEAVKECCLDLQNSHLANVNMVLWCCWLEATGIRLAPEVLPEVRSTIDAISQQTVVKLREVRAALVESGAFTRVQASLVKKHILSAELLVEKILLQKLQDMTSKYVEIKHLQPEEASRALGPEAYLRALGVPEFGGYIAVLRDHYSLLKS
jgi:uncharacterized protein (TIGR02444 family)